MKYWAVALIIVLIALSVQLEARAESWRGLQPLHSTRRDVERVLQVKSSGKTVDLFELKEWKVWVRYTNTACAQEMLKTRDSFQDVITLIVLLPKKGIYVDDLKVDLSSFKKTFVKDVAQAYILSSEELGLTIHTNDRKVVAGLEYYPAAEDRKSRCPEK